MVIESYSLDFVSDRLISLGVVDEVNRDLIDLEFKRFAALACFDDGPLAMISPLVDEFWHQFVLFTQSYKQFCDTALGFFMDHQPNVKSQPVPFAAIPNFLASYTKWFGELPPIWFTGMDERTVAYFKSGSITPPPPMLWSGWPGRK